MLGMVELNNNIGCFEIRLSKLGNKGMAMLNNNIGCFEICKDVYIIVFYSMLNNNIGCFEITAGSKLVSGIKVKQQHRMF